MCGDEGEALTVCVWRGQVAERALFLWNNEYIVSLIAKSREVILPVLYPALEANTTKVGRETTQTQRALLCLSFCTRNPVDPCLSFGCNARTRVRALCCGASGADAARVRSGLQHWNSTVHGLTFNVQKLFMDMDARLWEECTKRHKENVDRSAPPRFRTLSLALSRIPRTLFRPVSTHTIQYQQHLASAGQSKLTCLCVAVSLCRASAAQQARKQKWEQLERSVGVAVR